MFLKPEREEKIWSMSAGVSDQRMKGQGNQVSNGPKEQLGAGEGANGSEEFEPWRSQQQQQQNSAHTAAYGASVPISTATDIYSYYGSGGTYPYQAYGVGDGTWSNGTDPMTFLSGGYPAAHDSYSMDGMFGPSTTAFSTPTAFAGQPPNSFNYFHSNVSNGDYNTWGGSQLAGGAAGQQRKYDVGEYYRDPQNMYAAAAAAAHGAMADSAVKSMEQAMHQLDLKSDIKDSLGGGSGGGGSSSQPKKTTWASIASQPAKPQLPMQNQGLKKKGPGMPPGPIVPGKHNMDIGTWDTNKSTPPQAPPPIVNSAPKSVPPPAQMAAAAAAAAAANVRPGGGWNGPPATGANRQAPLQQQPRPPQHPMQPSAYQPQGMMPPHLPPQVGMPTGGHMQNMMAPQVPMMVAPPAANAPTHPVLDELRVKNNYNPTDFDLSAPNARFFVIKSYSEDDIHRSIKYEIWCSTEHGNKRLDQAFREREGNGPVYLFFSVNGSGHFCGMAQMMSPIDYNANSSVWSQDKWKGQFKVRWIYVKDVPNVQLRHIRLENNENKPVTNSRDTQEVPHAKGLQVLRVMHSYHHATSIFDDFIHYEKRQEEEDSRKQPTNSSASSAPSSNNHHGHHHSHRESNSDGHGHGGGRGASASAGGHDSGSGREDRGHRDRGDHYRESRGGGEHHRGGATRNHDRDDRDHHRSGRDGGGGGHRNNDHHHHHHGGHHHGGHHNKDRGDNNRGRSGRGGGGSSRN